MKKQFLILSALLVTAGCTNTTAPGASDVILVPPKSVYTAGETISAQLYNRSDAAIGYGACSTRLEKSSGGEWIALEPLQLCVAKLITLAAQTSRTLQFAVEPDIETGTYRLSHELTTPNRRIYSASFRVEGAVSN